MDYRGDKDRESIEGIRLRLSSCIIDRQTRGWRRVVPLLCLQIAKLRPFLRSIVGTVAMNERPPVSSRAKNLKWFWPGKVDDRFSGLASDKRIDLFANLFTGRSAEASLRHRSRKKLASDTTRNPLPVSRSLLSLLFLPPVLSILSFPSFLLPPLKFIQDYLQRNNSKTPTMPTFLRFPERLELIIINSC